MDFFKLRQSVTNWIYKLFGMIKYCMPYICSIYMHKLKEAKCKFRHYPEPIRRLRLTSSCHWLYTSTSKRNHFGRPLHATFSGAETPKTTVLHFWSLAGFNLIKCSSRCCDSRHRPNDLSPIIWAPVSVIATDAMLRAYLVSGFQTDQGGPCGCRMWQFILINARRTRFGHFVWGAFVALLCARVIVFRAVDYNINITQLYQNLL